MYPPPSLAWLTLSVMLLPSASLHSGPLRAKSPTSLGSRESPVAGASPLTVCRVGDRLLAIVDRALLGTDFLLRTPAMTVAPAFTDDAHVPHAPAAGATGVAPASATSLVGGALRLQR